VRVCPIVGDVSNATLAVMRRRRFSMFNPKRTRG
jgi:hypothetical protein